MTAPFNLSRSAVDANTEPISLAVAKLHLRVSGTSENAAIQSLCAVARQQCEAFTNRALAVSTYTLKLDAFPCGPLVLPVGVANVANVVITYTDTDGDTQTWDDEAYTVYQREDSFPEIAPVYGTTYPATRPETDAVTVIFTVGTFSVFDALKAGMLLYIGHLYEHREAVVVGTPAFTLPFAVDALWSPYRIVWL